MSESSRHPQNAADPSRGYQGANESVGSIFNVLRNDRRRRVVAYIAEHEDATISELARHIAADEQNKNASEIRSTEYKAVYVGLYQGHLEKLDAENIIQYNDRAGTVTKSDRTDDVLDLIETVADFEVVEA